MKSKFLCSVRGLLSAAFVNCVVDSLNKLGFEFPLDLPVNDKTAAQQWEGI